ncbi:MAG: sigma-70 family RNA polymerase sigma factor [Opitutaceae bacterium]
MNDDDAELLSRYADEGSESAFTELVQRHINLVYGAALRRTGGDPHRASEVAQQVFTALARNARRLSHHALLPAWLHTATRNAALNLMISEQRRQSRETEALALETAAAGNEISPDWNQLRPLLDAAIDELSEADRTAVILRFLERRRFAEIGAALQVSEDAARVRTDRALDKLRTGLGRRGVTSTSGALSALVLAQPLMSAPTGLVGILASQAIAAAGAGFFTTFMTTKIITAVALTALVAFGTGTYVGLSQHPVAETPASLARTTDESLNTSLRHDNRRLTDENSGLNADVAQLSAANAQLKTQIRTAGVTKNPTIGLAKWEVQRAIFNSLRQIDAARKQYKLEHGVAPSSIAVLVGRRSFIKTVRTVAGEDYSALPMDDGAPMTVTTLDGDTFTYDPSGATTTKFEIPPEVIHAEQLGKKVQPTIQKAAAAYQAAHNGNPPPNADALLAFFATPEEAADFSEFLEAQKAANAIGP